MNPQLTRRNLIAGLAAAAGSASAATNDNGRFTICAFSKHFQWTDVKEMCDICAGIGYEGIDLTLRPGGHVLPERVTEDLPKAAEIIKKAGLKFPMCTADIIDVQSPHAETMIKTMVSLGIRHYRWGGFKYKENVGLPEQLSEFKPRVKDLAALNKQYGITAMYHTHSGVNQVGASMWDLYLLIRDYDASAVSANYDIGHATVEGGFGGWIHSARLLTPFMRGVALKDFKWKQGPRGWTPGWCALGQGMVNFKQFLGMLKAAKFNGPLQLHMEYDELGGADSGKKTFTIPKPQLLAIYKRDIDVLKRMLSEGGLI
jgi:sugar phosphate isomerase/epimerase